MTVEARAHKGYAGVCQVVRGSWQDARMHKGMHANNKGPAIWLVAHDKARRLFALGS